MKPWFVIPSLLAAPVIVPLVAAVAFDNRTAPVTEQISADLLPPGPGDLEAASSEPVADQWLPSGASTFEDPADRMASADPDASDAATDASLSQKQGSNQNRNGVVRFGDTLIKIAQRYGITLSDLLRLNPGLETARLVVGSQVRLAQSGPVRSRALLALKPTTSGGVSWPELPDFGTERPGSTRFQRPVAGTLWTWPTKGVFTSGYGWRWGRMHKGIDVANNVGTPIVAARDGQVSFSGWSDGGYGYMVEILHPDGSKSRYAHNSRLEVRKGDVVQQGQMISRMGSTGRSTGPHLHFEIHPPGRGATNPLKLLPPRA